MEAIKWLALLSMTIDHANRFLFNSSVHSAFYAGRLAMPLFAFILAYNLAKPDTLSRGIYSRVLIRLIIFGLLATPGYIAMRHIQGLLPLNIMFTLGAAVALFYNYEVGNRLNALLIFLIGGLLVEYDWVGIFFCFSSWLFCRKPSSLLILTWFLAFVLLDNQNNNHWALLSIAIIYFATKIDIKIPRIRYLFYIYYPLHLYVLFLLSKLF